MDPDRLVDTVALKVTLPVLDCDGVLVKVRALVRLGVGETERDCDLDCDASDDFDSDGVADADSDEEEDGDVDSVGVLVELVVVETVVVDDKLVVTVSESLVDGDCELD